MNLVEEIKKEKLIQKYLYSHTWLSGSSTTVYPIMIWKNKKGQITEINIQVDIDKNVFNKMIERICNKHKEIKYGYFEKSDGSCPSNIHFRTIY